SVGSTFTEGAEGAVDASAPGTLTAERAAEGAGTHDGEGKEHHDGKPAPARRRRRRGGGGGAAPAAGA
ncbi:ATP-dependent helicase, partial [Microbacterium lacticum]|nr:ATP-dependent helicase [Microbacterium lacticum]